MHRQPPWEIKMTRKQGQHLTRPQQTQGKTDEGLTYLHHQKSLMKVLWETVLKA